MWHSHRVNEALLVIHPSRIGFSGQTDTYFLPPATEGRGTCCFHRCVSVHGGGRGNAGHWSLISGPFPKGVGTGGGRASRIGYSHPHPPAQDMPRTRLLLFQAGGLSCFHAKLSCALSIVTFGRKLRIDLLEIWKLTILGFVIFGSLVHGHVVPHGGSRVYLVSIVASCVNSSFLEEKCGWILIN